jgi:transposase
LAVATDTQGVPIHLEVLRGNRADTTTLQGLLASLQRRFGIQQAIFVFDNGMSSTPIWKPCA